MKRHIIFLYYILFVNYIHGGPCGCKTLTKCYENMLRTLLTKDETQCIEEAPIGMGTIMVYFKALTEFCGEFVKVSTNMYTYGERPLYEVELSSPGMDSMTPTIIIDAGQDGGTEPTDLALFIIQQLVACFENNEMIKKVRWVILPCTNPDGLELSLVKTHWKKNYRIMDDNMSKGVDISRNFESHWSSCGKNNNPFSPIYAGDAPNSENETIFIRDVLKKHRSNAKIYVSIKRDGHYLGYPHAYSSQEVENNAALTKVASEVAAKVNLRAGSVQVFLNDSIHALQGKPHCGNSADYALDLGIPLSYEMRVFLAKEKSIMSMFHSLPRGYESMLRSGYYNGIKELYNSLVNEKKYGNLFVRH